MKKLFSVIAFVLSMTFSASAVEIDPHYKGYAETFGGVMVIPKMDYVSGDPVASYGFSTSHGVSLFEGLFVGGGIQGDFFSYEERDFNFHKLGTEFGGILVAFAEARYNFLRTRKISPFAGLRFGGGYNSVGETGCFYFSPAVGCSFDFTQKFGLDVSLALDLYNFSGEYDYDSRSLNMINIGVRVGLHF